jgi:hypothetical protein
LASAANQEESYGFLVNSKFQSFDENQLISWLRLFGILCPSRVDIDRRLVFDLIAAHIRAGNLPLARQIAERCPQLGLTEIFAEVS